MSQYETQSRPKGGVMLIPRSRGALSGFLLILLGIWGALIPFVGPYFNYGYTADSWQWTLGRFWLEIVPGVVALLGGLILLTTANRASAVFGGWLASAAGAWFVLGPVFSPLWGGAAADVGIPLGGTKRQVAEQLGFFSGLGVVILFLGAHAAGRVTVRSVRDLEAVQRRAAEPVVVDERPPASTPDRSETSNPGRESTAERAATDRSGATAASDVQERPGSTSARERR